MHPVETFELVLVLLATGIALHWAAARVGFPPSGAVLFTTLAVGLVAKLLLPDLPWAACFALGAIVSPPDAVAARSVLSRVTLPRRLQALLEGESLLNDATGLVLFRFAVAATLVGSFSTGEAVGN